MLGKYTYYIIICILLLATVIPLTTLPVRGAGSILVYKVYNPYMAFFHDIVVPMNITVSDPGIYYLKWKLNYTVIGDTYYVWLPAVPPGESYLYVVPGDGAPSTLPSTLLYYTDFSDYSDWSNTGWSLAYANGRLELTLTASDDNTHEAYFTRDMPVDVEGAGYRAVLYVEWYLPRLSSTTDDALAKLLGDNVYYLVEDWTNPSDYSIRYRYERFYSGTEYYDVYSGVANRFAMIDVRGYDDLDVTVTDLGTGDPVSFTLSYNTPTQLRFYGKIQYGSTWGSEVDLHLYNMTIYRWAPVTVSLAGSVDSLDVFATSIGNFYGGYNQTFTVWGENQPSHYVITINSQYDVTDYSINLGDIQLIGYNFTDSNGNPVPYTILNDGIWIKVNLTAGDNYIYIYSGDNGLNDPYKVFIIYDDFDNQTTMGELVGVSGTDYGFVYVDDVNKYALWLDNIDTDYAKIQYILSYNVDLPIVVEYDFWVATTTLRNGYTQVGHDDGTTFTRIILLMYESGNIKSYDGSTYTDLVPPANYGTTRKHFKLIVDSNDPKLIDTEEHTVNVWNSLTEINKIIFSTYSAGYYTGKRYLDNIRVYKYVDPEPSVSISAIYDSLVVTSNREYLVTKSYFLYANGTLVETNIYNNMYVPANVSEYSFNVIADPPPDIGDTGNTYMYTGVYYDNSLYIVTLYNVSLYGGDEIYMFNKSVNGLLASIQRGEIQSNVLDLGTSLDKCLVQASIDFVDDGQVEGVKGFGVALNGYYDTGVGVFVNGTHIFVSEIAWDRGAGTWSWGTTYWSVGQDFTGNINTGTVYFKIGVIGSLLLVAVNFYDPYSDLDQWFLVNLNLTSTVYVSHIVVLDQFGGYTYVGDVLFMRGDYLRFRSITSPFTIRVDGVDARGKSVNVEIADNDPLDDDPNEAIIQWSMIPAIYPITGNVSTIITTGTTYLNLTGTIHEYTIDITGKYNDTRVNTSGLQNLELPLFTDFADYRDIVAVFIIAFVLLIGNRNTIPMFLSIAGGLLILFTVIGWLSIASGVLGLAVLIVALSWVLLHKE